MTDTRIMKVAAAKSSQSDPDAGAIASGTYQEGAGQVRPPPRPWEIRLSQACRAQQLDQRGTQQLYQELEAIILDTERRFMSYLTEERKEAREKLEISDLEARKLKQQLQERVDELQQQIQERDREVEKRKDEIRQLQERVWQNLRAERRRSAVAAESVLW